MLIIPEETPETMHRCLRHTVRVRITTIELGLDKFLTSRKRAWSFARNISQHGEAVGAAPSSPESLALRALRQELVFSVDPPRARDRQPAPPRARSQLLHHACPSAVGARRWWSSAVVEPGHRGSQWSVEGGRHARTPLGEQFGLPLQR